MKVGGTSGDSIVLKRGRICIIGKERYFTTQVKLDSEEQLALDSSPQIRQELRHLVPPGRGRHPGLFGLLDRFLADAEDLHRWQEVDASTT